MGLYIPALPLTGRMRTTSSHTQGCYHFIHTQLTVSTSLPVCRHGNGSPFGPAEHVPTQLSETLQCISQDSPHPAPARFPLALSDWSMGLYGMHTMKGFATARTRREKIMRVVGTCNLTIELMEELNLGDVGGRMNFGKK